MLEIKNTLGDVMLSITEKSKCTDQVEVIFFRDTQISVWLSKQESDMIIKHLLNQFGI